MPRGNDASTAGAELSAKLGVDLNAEEMILANKARFSPELKAALMKKKDEDASEAIDPEVVESMTDRTIVAGDSVAVRGDKIVYVYLDGRKTEKDFVLLADYQAEVAEPEEAPAPAPKKAAKKAADAPKADDSPSKVKDDE